ncbi:MAG: hypothetical protein ACFFDK_17690 [Promethearchaeota archaeon]
MTDLHISIPNKGLPIGSKAPNIETTDIDENEVNLTVLLKNHRGVLIDFFRGGW